VERGLKDLLLVFYSVSGGRRRHVDIVTKLKKQKERQQNIAHRQQDGRDSAADAALNKRWRAETMDVTVVMV